MSIDKSINNLYIRPGGAVYFYPTGGDITTNGCIKIQRDGNDMVIWRKASGAWVEIWRYSA